MSFLYDSTLFDSTLLETGTFTSSNGGKIATWQEVQAISADDERLMKDRRKCILKIRACFQKCTGGF